MATDSSKKPTRRKPTKRAAARPTTTADSHYSKLTRKAYADGSRTRRSRESASGTQRSATKAMGSRQASQRTGQGARRQGGATQAGSTARKATSYESLSTGTKRKVYGKREPRRQQRSGNILSTVLGIAVIAAFILAGALFWTHRSVNVTVNGEHEKIRINSTLESVHDKLKIQTKPGDFVSVAGNVLAKDEGYPFSASIDGTELTHEQLEEYRVRGGEQIEIYDGGSRVEDYDITYREAQPKIVFEGSWGSVSFVKQWGRPGKQEVRKGKESGDTADGDWVEELQDCIIKTKNIEPADGRKLVALTFDDGPAATYTEAYLDILDRYGAKATFFNLSENESEYPELAQKVAASGNQIVSHTNQHLQLSTLDKSSFLYELTSARETISQVAGVDTTIIRPPYGDFNQNCWLMSDGELSASILWNQDTLDWSMPGVDVIVENALADMTSGSIILMHDGGGNREQDIEALPRIIESLQSDGYELVTLSELLASDPEVPADVAAGNAQMPADAVWPLEIGEATIDVG